MSLTVNGKPLDDPSHIYIVGEISGNHNQDYKHAEQLVVAAAEAGADAVKLQTFMADEICADIPFPYGHDAAHDAWARKLGVVGMRDLFRLGGFPRPWHAPLKKFAESCGIAFLSTPFSVDAARFLVEEIGVQGLKIASGDLTFTPLLEYAASVNLPVIMSTGGATMDEVREAMQIFDDADYCPVVLHCLSVYPCEEAIINLRALKTISRLLDCPTGFSDHTLSFDIVPAVAAATGECCVYEKHIRLDDDTTSIDVGHSLTPPQFATMVDILRRVPQMLGSGIKEPHPLEMHDRLWARRGGDGLRPTERAREGVWE